MAPMKDAADHFATHGWVLVPDLVPLADVEAAQPQLFRIYPRPEEVASGEVTERTRPFVGGGSGDASRKFRLGQFTGLREAPTGDPALDVLAVHHRILDLVEAILGTTDIRLYQAETFAKYSGAADYEQPLHIDETNHSLVPMRRDGQFRQVQLFLYLSDVTEARGATRVVSRQVTSSVPRGDLVFANAGGVHFDEHETAAVGGPGTVLAYSADTVHRGTAMTEPGAGRFFFNLAYRPAGHDWLGALPWPRRGIDPAMQPWIEALDVRQLCVLGFPPPGHPYWDPETIAATQDRYPNLDLSAFG